LVPFLHQYNNVLNLNDSYLQYLTTRADECGYTEFYNKHMTFPPSGPMPPSPDPDNLDGCYLWEEAYLALIYVNPCFNIYHVTDFCPYLWDELGFPSLAGGPNNYFNRSDVQNVLHAPPTDYSVCGENQIFPNGDQSPPSGLGPLPSVIERTNNVLIGHGLLDMILIANGTLMTIQNMTWNGMQGFQKAPPSSENLYVPYHNDLAELFFANLTPPFTQDAGAGLLGTWHTERGLTYSTVKLAGHMIPQYSPGTAYRQLEFLLGRIKNLSQTGDFTTMTGNFTGTIPPLTANLTGS
jgi:carboxypeptidase D